MVLQGMGEGDRLDYVKGMLVWHFWVGTELYRVNSQQYWEELPRPEILSILYRHDRKRLSEWLEARDKEWQRPKVQLAGTQYMRLVKPRRKLLEPEERERRKRERWKRDNLRRQGPSKRALPRWPNLIKNRFEAWEQPNGSKYYAAFPLSDHDYIEAMFWLYSQQRSRLLA